jgi:hypothetical protein
MPRDLEDLKNRSKRARRNPDLVEIARQNSPSQAFRLALAKVHRHLAWECANLARIRRDYGEDIFEEWINLQDS